jgi:hypothetical protein
VNEQAIIQRIIQSAALEGFPNFSLPPQLPNCLLFSSLWIFQHRNILINANEIHIFGLACPPTYNCQDSTISVYGSKQYGGQN